MKKAIKEVCGDESPPELEKEPYEEAKRHLYPRTKDDRVREKRPDFKLDNNNSRLKYNRETYYNYSRETWATNFTTDR